MGKKSRRKAGARRYADYSEETLKLAVDLVKSKSLSSYEAEKQFGIPRRTILNHCKNKQRQTFGRPNELSVEDESHIAEVLEVSGKFGCPLSMLDLRMVVHNYIQKSGRTNLFNGKMPGERWARNFLERHNFSMRATQNIKRSRAAKNVEELSTYFEHLESSIKDVPSKNILNFDETNLSDDPGSSKTAFKRGTKHPERVLNSSKTSISIMFSVTADGVCLPPYVVYKAEHLWSQWCKNGPLNARYNRTKSGWFDMNCFDDWFKTIVLPWAKSLEGPKVIIGDNLSSHLSVEVMQLCKENNISLVFLPPNSTHLTQPLDVAFFGPMKKIWRKILLDYKVANSNVTTMNKIHFPELLRELMISINMSSSKIISSGFAACGIFPFNPMRVLKKIPAVTIEEAKQFDVSLIQYLETNRKTQTQAKTTNNKRLAIVAGKSVTAEDINKLIKSKAKSTIKNKKNSKTNKVNPSISQSVNSLQVLCINTVNKLLFKGTNEQSPKPKKKTDKKKTLQPVRLLGRISRHDKENTAFSTANVDDLPTCLQTVSNDKSKVSLKSTPKSKITILKDVIIAPGPSGIKRSAKSNAPKKRHESKNIKRETLAGSVALNTKIIPRQKVEDLQPTRRTKKGIKIEKQKNCEKRRALRYSRSSTSISDEISVHSDSSLMDISDEIDSDDLPLCDFTNISSPNRGKNEPTKIPSFCDNQIAANVQCEENTENLSLPKLNDPRRPKSHISMNSSGKLNDSQDLLPEVNLSDTNCKKRSNDDSQNLVKTGSEASTEIPQSVPNQASQEKNEPQLVPVIDVDDKVLVRYYSKNTWKYYVGVVTMSNNDDTFDISFYTTVRTQGDLKFKKPRRLDRDTVPREYITKVIELSKISEKPEVYHLSHQKDANYF